MAGVFGCTVFAHFTGESFVAKVSRAQEENERCLEISGEGYGSFHLFVSVDQLKQIAEEITKGVA